MTHHTDMISRAEADRQTQEAVAEATKLVVPVAAMDQHIKEAVAAALMGAMEKIEEACRGSLSLGERSDEDIAYDEGVEEGCAAAVNAIRGLIAQEEGK